MKKEYIYRTGLGQDSHRFLPEESSKPCILAGVLVEGAPGLSADSDGDPVFHALCNAISSLIHVPILGGIAKTLCHKHDITDSKIYLERGLKLLSPQEIVHIAVSIEAKRPLLEPILPTMRNSLAAVCSTDTKNIGMTVTSGDEMSFFGQGKGVQCFCVLTTRCLSL